MSVQGFRTPEEVATFGSLMQGLADIVVGKYDGSLKVTTACMSHGKNLAKDAEEMHQLAHQVSAFLRDCAQRRWANPPLDVLFADGLTAEEADALQGVDGGGLHPESSDLFLSAISDEFYDVYSDAYYDTGTP
jgi:hypothetical protein